MSIYLGGRLLDALFACFTLAPGGVCHTRDSRRAQEM